MEIMELGAIGELVGGVAVLITLVYLALQVSQNVRQQKLSSLQAAVLGYSERIEGILGDADRLSAFWKGLEGRRDMSAGERAKFHAIMIGTISVFENNWNLYRAGVLPHEQIVVHEHDIVAILKSPGAVMWWEASKRQIFSESIKHHIDGLLRDSAPEIAALSDNFTRLFGPLDSLHDDGPELEHA